MKRYLKRSALFSTLICLSACTAIIDTATNKPIETDPGKRSFGAYLDDERLEVIAGVNINKASQELKLANINVTSFNKILLLTGQTPSEETKLLAQKTVENINTVRKVFNELQIKGNTALLVRTNDSILSTKVKAVLIADKLIESGKVKVIVEDGVVYLMGLVTHSEADYIGNVVSNVAGVQEVVKVFEYL